MDSDPETTSDADDDMVLDTNLQQLEKYANILEDMFLRVKLIITHIGYTNTWLG